MAKSLLVKDGKLMVTADGKLMVGEPLDCCYRQARKCSDGALADVWMSQRNVGLVEAQASESTPAFQIGGEGDCYYFGEDGSSPCPGTTYTASEVTVRDDCDAPECATCFRQARSCVTEDLADIWMTCDDVEVLEGSVIQIVDHGECFYFDENDATSSTAGGTVYAYEDVYVEATCDAEDCLLPPECFEECNCCRNLNDYSITGDITIKIRLYPFSTDCTGAGAPGYSFDRRYANFAYTGHTTVPGLPGNYPVGTVDEYNPSSAGSPTGVYFMLRCDISLGGFDWILYLSNSPFTPSSGGSQIARLDGDCDGIQAHTRCNSPGFIAGSGESETVEVTGSITITSVGCCFDAEDTCIEGEADENGDCLESP